MNCYSFTFPFSDNEEVKRKEHAPEQNKHSIKKTLNLFNENGKTERNDSLAEP